MKQRDELYFVGDTAHSSEKVIQCYNAAVTGGGWAGLGLHRSWRPARYTLLHRDCRGGSVVKSNDLESR